MSREALLSDAEWARIEPAEKEHDRGAVDHYRRMLGAAHDEGIVPWACLFHQNDTRLWSNEIALPRNSSRASGMSPELSPPRLETAVCHSAGRNRRLPLTARPLRRRDASRCMRSALTICARWKFPSGKGGC